MTKIIDKIKAIQKTNKNQEQIKSPPYYHSFEYFPPKTEAGADNLEIRIERMVQKLSPIFIDVTWGSNYRTTCDKSLSLAEYAQRYCSIDVLLHITCIGMTYDKIKYVLDRAKLAGIQNILCLRGDITSRDKTKTNGDCEYAIDLIKYIKKNYGDYFCIGIAGHPESHPLSNSIDDEMIYLKEKVDVGIVDFILTQFFYDVSKFISYVKRCREYDILCPIIPGMMPIMSYTTLIRMTEFCNISIPKEILLKLEPVKNDDEAVKKIGVTIALECCNQIFTLLDSEKDNVHGVHFYTLNLERSVTEITLQLHPDLQSQAHLTTNRVLPWRASTHPKRKTEEIRPIHWANRPKSYLSRTDDWDEFHNGRWGDSTSPAFGDISNYCHTMSRGVFDNDDIRRSLLGDYPTSTYDIQQVFLNFIQSSSEAFLPWCEGDFIQAETYPLREILIKLNSLGFWTINSQPAVNAAPSNHDLYGWGGSNGYVYQKPYCEFFAPYDLVISLSNKIKQSYPTITLYAVNHDSSSIINASTDETETSSQQQDNNNSSSVTTALTWGVFPNREILQPTIFDSQTYCQVWSEEAFALWKSVWMNLYDVDSTSWCLIENIFETYYLVSVYDNDYITDGGEQLWTVLEMVGKEREKCNDMSNKNDNYGPADERARET